MDNLLSGIAHEREEVALRLRNAHDIGRTLAVQVRLQPRTQRLVVEAIQLDWLACLLSYEVALRGPDLNPTVFEGQEFLLLV